LIRRAAIPHLEGVELLESCLKRPSASFDGFQADKALKVDDRFDIWPARCARVPFSAGGADMTGACEIQPLEAKDHQAWVPLWNGYQAFYRVSIPDEVSALTWSRLLDPAEPMSGAMAWNGDGAVGLVHSFVIGPAGRSATIATSRISLSLKPSVDLASAEC
jgi:hypothetical protein